ncbi:MAG: Fur family transcriptional regulator [Bacillota bacterium]
MVKNANKAAQEELKRRGYKLTGPRVAIVNYLAHSQEHPDMRQIFSGIQTEHPDIGMTTVYRTLDLLLELDILRAISLKKNQLRYELKRPDDHHHHLICTRCNQIMEFGSCNFARVSREIEAVTRYIIEDHTLEVYGLCPQCRAG